MDYSATDNVLCRRQFPESSLHGFDAWQSEFRAGTVSVLPPNKKIKRRNLRIQQLTQKASPDSTHPHQKSPIAF